MSSITSSSYPVVTLSKAGDQFAIVQGGQLKKLTRQGLADYIATLAPNTFIALTDGPGSYVGQAGKAVVVKATEDGVEFEAATAGNFNALSDTPSSKLGQAGRLAAVNSAETALEYIDNSLIKVVDFPNSYSGQGGKLVVVNTAETGVEFVTPAEEQTTGWGQYIDTAYTSGSPFSVTAGTTVDMPNNAGTVIETQLPDGVTSFYNGTVITPGGNFDSYNISIRFTSESSVLDGALRVAIDIGGGIGEIVSDFRRLVRSAGIANQCTIEFDVYAGTTFNTNGGTIRFEAIDGDHDVYDISYFIARTHKGK